MSSKLDTFEKIHEIIDEEIEKSKKAIVTRCKCLFDKFLGKQITRKLKKSYDFNISLDDIHNEMEEDDDNDDDNNDNNDNDDNDDNDDDNDDDDDKEETDSIVSGISDKIIVKPNGDIEIIRDDQSDEESGDENDGESGDESADEDVGIYEMDIHNTTYLVTTDEPSFIFEKLEDEGVGDCVGIIYEDEPYLLTSYKGRQCYLCTKSGDLYEYIDDTTIGKLIQ